MAIAIDANFKSVLTCHVGSPGEYMFGQNAVGDIDTYYREFDLTVAQLVEAYGIENVSLAVKDRYDRGEYDGKHRVVTAIEPNMNWVDGRPGPVGMEYSCITIQMDTDEQPRSGGLRDEEGKPLLEKKGYSVWPVPNLRWDVSSGNVYGDGPGLMALGDSRALQTLERRKAQMIDKIAAPPMQGPPQLRNSPVSHVPGGMTYIDPTGAGAGTPINPLYVVPPVAITVVQQEILMHESRIDQAYFKDLFLLLATTDRREITAREVEEKHEEKLLALGPMLQRTHRDGLDNAVRRCDYLVARRGLYPEPPRELAGQSLKVEYVSTLAHAQRSVTLGALERVFMFTSTLATTHPEVIRKLNPFAAVDEYADIVGAPAKVMVPTRQAEEAIKADMAAQQAQQAMAAIPEGAQTVKALSETDVAAPSALNRVGQREPDPVTYEEALKSVMATAAGRIVVWEQLSRARLFVCVVCRPVLARIFRWPSGASVAALRRTGTPLSRADGDSKKGSQ